MERAEAKIPESALPKIPKDSVHMERAEAKITVFMYLNEAKDSVHMEYTKVLYRYSEKKCKSYLEVVEGQLKGEIGA